MPAPPDHAPPDHVSLSRGEAARRAQDLTVTSMRLELDLTRGAETFSSTTTIRVDSASGGETFVDFAGKQLVAATLNGTQLDAGSWRRGRIALPGLQPHNTLVVEGVMAYSNDGEGLHRHVDPADEQAYLYAMSFLDAGPRWFACFDQPDLKAPYELLVQAPADWTVLGNGPGELTARGSWRITPIHPLSTYFVTLVAGPYASVLDEHDGIPLGFHVKASLGDALRSEAADLIAVTKASFDYFHRVFGVRYPFGEYHQAFVPEFNAGAMENPGCVTLRDQYVFRARATRSERAHRAGTMAHEMAHMWFGDLVTMRWWHDLWLNESFAEYLAHRACEEGEVGYSLWTEFGIVRKDWGSVADQGPSTHPVAGRESLDAESALQDFDGISYAKGAAVLRQLVALVGDEVFFGGLRDYFETHAYSNAEFDDLIGAWTRAGAQGLPDWADAWLRTSGMDTIDVVAAHGVAMVTSTPPVGQERSRPHALQIGALDDQGRLFSRTAVRLGSEPVGVEVPVDVRLLVPDVGDETWAKIRFGAGGWAALGEVLPHIVDPSARVVAFNSLRDGVRNAELSPGQALDLICAAVLDERSEIVFSSVLDFAQDQLAGPYCPTAERASRRRQVFETAQAVLDRSPAGSDHQLAAFRRVILSCDDVSLLRGWLASSGVPERIDVDAELRWSIVSRLAALVGDESLVDATLADDRSGLALVYAARARASLPTATAKANAWALMMQPSPISAYELYATAEGFVDPTQTELTAPYVARFFPDIVATSEFRSGWALGRVASLGFPSLAVTAETLDLAEDTLARDDLAAPLRRSLLDRTDRLRRALRALERAPELGTG